MTNNLQYFESASGKTRCLAVFIDYSICNTYIYKTKEYTCNYRYMICICIWIFVSIRGIIPKWPDFKVVHDHVSAVHINIIYIYIHMHIYICIHTHTYIYIHRLRISYDFTQWLGCTSKSKSRHIWVGFNPFNCGPSWVTWVLHPEKLWAGNPQMMELIWWNQSL